ncbi:MAG: hypothetical protein QOI18_1070 [Solirubrobacteraceae bacterium]|jgi:hypothetical protein|nr:hypothetical protein [Solirubrobacteraceae bacterium]
MKAPAEGQLSEHEAPSSGDVHDGGRRVGLAVDPVAVGRNTVVPDFFIVGHQKCGTTALYMMLSAHPQIFMPDVKEPWFFALELRSRFGAPGSRSRPSTLDAYLSLFADAAPGQRVGEASPQYIRSETAARQIAELRPDARIVAILREPAAFLRSLHLQLVATHIESEKDFIKALSLEDARRRGKRIPRRSVSPQSLLYSDHVRYVEQLRRLREAFPAEQLLVLIYDDFRRDNEGTVREVLRFLEVDDGVPVQTVETQPLKAVRSMPLHRLRRAIRKAGLHPAKKGRISRAIDAWSPRGLGSDDLSALFRRATYTAQSPADAEFMLALRRRFKPEVVALSDYLDRDLVKLWGYDELD